MQNSDARVCARNYVDSVYWRDAPPPPPPQNTSGEGAMRLATRPLGLFSDTCGACKRIRDVRESARCRPAASDAEFEEARAHCCAVASSSRQVRDRVTNSVDRWLWQCERCAAWNVVPDSCLRPLVASPVVVVSACVLS